MPQFRVLGGGTAAAAVEENENILALAVELFRMKKRI
jgi:hypothetical protein